MLRTFTPIKRKTGPNYVKCISLAFHCSDLSEVRFMIQLICCDHGYSIIHPQKTEKKRERKCPDPVVLPECSVQHSA